MTDAKYTEKDMIEFAIEVMRSMPDYLSSSAKPADILEKFITSKEPKKEWEIVAFKYRGDIIPLMEDWQKHRCYSQPVYAIEGQQLSLEWALKPENNCAIHSVRRLSDGEIFSVGDKASTPAIQSGRIIKSFQIIGGGMAADFDDGRAGINLLQKPTALFTTLDGVDLVDGDEFWATRYNRMDIVNPYKACFKTKEWFTAEKGYRLFSTREAAETYILENRALLSIKDLRELLIHCVGLDLTNEIVGFATNLVKSKLNP